MLEHLDISSVLFERFAKFAGKKSHRNLNTLIFFFFFRANASLNLEGQIKKVDGLVSGFEKKLSEDGPIPDEPNALRTHNQDIQVRTSLFDHS